MQDYQLNSKTGGASGQTSSGAPSTQTPTLFGVPITTQQPKTGSIFGGGTSGAFGTTTGQPAMGPFGAVGPQQSATGTGIDMDNFTRGQPDAGTGTGPSGSATSGLLKHATTFGSIFSQPSRCLVTNYLTFHLTSSTTDPVLDPGKLERMKELLRKSLLGEEPVNTQFHLFSARSSLSGQVMKPRVLCANNDLLAKSSKYFLDRE